MHHTITNNMAWRTWEMMGWHNCQNGIKIFEYQEMKTVVTAMLCVLFWPQIIVAQNDTINDSTAIAEQKKEIRKAKRKLARQQLSQHFSIGVHATYAYINSAARFEEKNGILSASIDLEEHFGLENEKMVYSGFIIYRITPRSGVNGLYYQLNRNQDNVLDQDIIFQDDTIKKGTQISGYFNTQVISFGYMFSILTESKAFLGLIVNFYLTDVKLGITAEAQDIKRNVTYIAAIPNFGLAASFQLRKWLTLAGGIRLFFYNSSQLSGTFNDVQILAEFNPTKWLGLSVGYQVFDVKSKFPEDNFNVYVDYNLKGPTVGLRFRF